MKQGKQAISRPLPSRLFIGYVSFYFLFFYVVGVVYVDCGWLLAFTRQSVLAE